MARKPKGDYEVGYGRPPKAHQFKKGRSGNSNGRPKGRVRLESAIEKAIRRKVRVREGRRVRTISAIDAVMAKQFELAMKGNLKAAEQIMKYATLFVSNDDHPIGADAGQGPSREDDEETLRDLLRLMDVEAPKSLSGSGETDDD